MVSWWEIDKTLFFVAKLLRFESNRATFRTEEVSKFVSGGNGVVDDDGTLM